MTRASQHSGVTRATDQQLSRSFTMLQPAMYEAFARERAQVHNDQVRRAYLRQLAVLRRRQRRVDAARRALHALQVM